MAISKDETDKAERNLTVLGNRLDMLKHKAKFINSESVAETIAVIGTLESAMTEAADNGENVDFQIFADSIGRIPETS